MDGDNAVNSFVMLFEIPWNMYVPHDNTTLAYKLFADVDVALHDVVERRVVDSAGFFANDTRLEKHSRNGNVRGDSDDVSV